jgi:predicted DNA-binding transcriptional regulator YafY
MAVVEDAMAFSRALQITYSPSFHEAEEHIFHPQYLRNYNGRRYVYGVYENEEENNGLPFVTLPVDRIVTARLTKAVPYRPGDPQAYEAQLRNVLGASPNFRNPEVLEVVIRSHDPKVHKLLLSKPLHHSIREQQSCTAEQTGLLTMRVQMTQELYNWILYYGKGIEVLEPAELRERIAIGLSQMVTYYNAE